MERRRTFQIVHVGPTNICQHSTTDLARGIMTNERKQNLRCRRHGVGLSNILKLQEAAVSSYSIYSIVVLFITNEQVKLASFTSEGFVGWGSRA